MQCWLKKQKDVMAPAVVARGEDVMWTSGLVFGRGEVGFHATSLSVNFQFLRIRGIAP